jgi:phage baseplate assembly protein W
MAVYTDLNTDYVLNSGSLLLHDMTALQNKLFNLLRCRLGSRFRQPRFGTRLPELVHEPCDEHTAEEIMRDFIDKIGEWMSDEIELILEQTYVVPRPSGDGFLVHLAYYAPKLRSEGALSFSALRN